MILLIDNYDSFSYNLYQLAGALEPDIRVIRNDAVSVEGVIEMGPQAIILSPGPGRPENAGLCVPLIRAAAGKIPILGVCLGHQAICEAFGGKVTYAKKLMHGKSSPLMTAEGSRLFRGIRVPISAARYHSLAAEEASLPDCLAVTARDRDGEIMAVEHRKYPVFGVQFHPESVMTPDGAKIIKNFMEAARDYD